MSVATTVAQYRARFAAFWLARTAQERRFLTIGGAVALAALLYLILVEPAVDGRAQLRRTLPQLPPSCKPWRRRRARWRRRPQRKSRRCRATPSTPACAAAA
jgi:hypothetical protein